jgi:hypothetical protein
MASSPYHTGREGPSRALPFATPKHRHASPTISRPISQRLISLVPAPIS